MQDKEFPEFTAFELNALTKVARRNDYYAKCKKFLEDTVLKEGYDVAQLTENQRKWLWGIKADLMTQVDGQ